MTSRDEDSGSKAVLYVLLFSGALLCAGSVGGGAYFAFQAMRNVRDGTVRRAESMAFEARRAEQYELARSRYQLMAIPLSQALRQPNRLADSYTRDGKPLLSWRVHLLPHLGLGELYKQFKLDEPWDGPTNFPLLASIPPEYQPVDPGRNWSPGDTRVRGMGFPGAVFEANAKWTVEAMKARPDLVLAVFDGVDPHPWTKPDGEVWPADASPPGMGGSLSGNESFLAITVSGKVVEVETEASPAQLRNLFKRVRPDGFDVEAPTWIK